MPESRTQSGLTLVELVTVVALASMILVAATSYSIPRLAMETLRSGAHDLQAFLQLAKMEAVSRNRPCRFLLDTVSGDLQVLDTLGSSTVSDDVLLHGGSLPDSVSFGRPDGGTAVTLEEIGSSQVFQVVFDSDGTVMSGTGDVFLRGGESFRSVSVYAAGGIEIHRWDGTSWKAGS